MVHFLFLFFLCKIGKLIHMNQQLRAHIHFAFSFFACRTGRAWLTERIHAGIPLPQPVP